MTAGELSAHLNLSCLAGENGLEKPLQGCFVGDLLSHALARVSQGNVWITIHGHPNAVAVGVETKAGCIILCDSATLDPAAAARANEFRLPVFGSKQSAYTLASQLAALQI